MYTINTPNRRYCLHWYTNHHLLSTHHLDSCMKNLCYVRNMSSIIIFLGPVNYFYTKYKLKKMYIFNV